MMNQLSEGAVDRPGRVFPERRLSAEDKAKRQQEMEEFDARGQAIFEKVKPSLIEDYYNWFMVIEPDSEDYFLDPDEVEAEKKAREKHPDAEFLIVCINETGVCGRA